MCTFCKDDGPLLTSTLIHRRAVDRIIHKKRDERSIKCKIACNFDVSVSFTFRAFWVRLIEHRTLFIGLANVQINYILFDCTNLNAARTA